jgi:hypothetical protein
VLANDVVLDDVNVVVVDVSLTVEVVLVAVDDVELVDVVV